MLPADARFCHRCGKPQFELPAEEPETNPAPDSVPVIAADPLAALSADISFHNPVAVRIALGMGVTGILLSSLPIPLPFLWPLLALMITGGLAVFLYMKRTGAKLSVRAGARMGWLTGIFSFAIVAVLFTLIMVFIANNGGFGEFYKEAMKANLSSAEVERIVRELESPGKLAAVLLATLGTLFVLFTTFPMLGGALGAKLLTRDDS